MAAGGKLGRNSSSSLLLSAVTTAPGKGRARGSGASGSARNREPDVDALPVSSSSDEDEDNAKDEEEEDDDESPAARRGDMTRTTFQRTAPIAAPPVHGRWGGGPNGSTALAPRVRPPAKTLLVALERKRNEKAKAKKAEESEEEPVRSTSASSNSRGTKRARSEAAASTTAALKARQSPPSPPSSEPQPGRLPSSSNSGGGGGSGLFDQGRQRPRSVGYSRNRPGLMVRDRTTTAAGSEATSRTKGKDTKTKKAMKEAEADTPKFIVPPPLTPEQDSPPPPQAKFRHYKGTTVDSKNKDENEDASESPKFQWPAGLSRAVPTEADDKDEDHKKPKFKWPAGAPREPDAKADEDEDDKASDTKTKTTTRTNTTRTRKTTSSPSPPPPKTTAKIPVGATLESLKYRQKWRKNKEANRQQQKGLRRPAGGKAGTSLFGELELETNAGDGDDDAEEVSSPEPRAVFRMPAGYDGRHAASGPAETAGTGAGDDGRSLDDLLAADSDDGDSSDSTLPLERPPATCPVCKAAVDDEAVRALLAALLPGDAAVVAAAAAVTTTATATKGRARETTTAADLVRRHLLRFDDKLRFCEGHRQRASRAAWVARGYPAIDWAALGGRLRAHYGHVRRILEDETPSVFRAAMEGRGGGDGGSSSGARRSRKAVDGAGQSAAVTPGYYGQKGLRVLTEAIVLEFAGLLRQRAVADRLIAARGSSQFVEAVLVPELAVQLIREDMGVGAAEAQRILWESGTIGEDVHGEERDVVMEEEEEDDVDDDDDDGW